LLREQVWHSRRWHHGQLGAGSSEALRLVNQITAGPGNQIRAMGNPTLGGALEPLSPAALQNGVVLRHDQSGHTEPSCRDPQCMTPGAMQGCHGSQQRALVAMGMHDVRGADQTSQEYEVPQRLRGPGRPRPPQAHRAEVEVPSGERMGNHHDLHTTLAQIRAELGDMGPDPAGAATEQHDDLH